jgi:polysaccharide export outer membrane protein
VTAALLFALLGGTSCIGMRIVYPVLPTPEELREFEAAGPADLVSDVFETASMHVSGPYRVVTGDLLLIELPPEVQLDTLSGETKPATLTIKCRVQDPAGTIELPMIGAQTVVGKTTGEIEELLAAAYHSPKILDRSVNVVVTVSEYRSVTVAVTGAVNQPGPHDLRSDRLSVMGALAEAGGVKGERGAKAIQVIAIVDGQTVKRTLGVQLGDIPLEDVPLKGGETIVVEPAPDRAFTVIGLVKKSGVFEYPVPRRYNLMQALATAGGVDETAAPRYATIYRVRADGQVVGATFQIDGTALQNASNVRIKDGDVIAVEHTQGSWLRQFFSQVLGFRASATLTTSTPTL